MSTARVLTSRRYAGVGASWLALRIGYRGLILLISTTVGLSLASSAPPNRLAPHRGAAPPRADFASRNRGSHHCEITVKTSIGLFILPAGSSSLSAGLSLSPRPGSARAATASAPPSAPSPRRLGGKRQHRATRLFPRPRGGLGTGRERLALWTHRERGETPVQDG
ncbi:hypothetical protein B0H13DRAFT_2020612 [Mycena leptocephala]|nr:hypothetical protein B0H13DRAFT_2020612 [Mycena leptocephala]